MTNHHKAILFLSGIGLFVFLLIGSVVVVAFTRGGEEDLPSVDWDPHSEPYYPQKEESNPYESRNISNFNSRVGSASTPTPDIR